MRHESQLAKKIWTEPVLLRHRIEDTQSGPNVTSSPIEDEDYRPDTPDPGTGS